MSAETQAMIDAFIRDYGFIGRLKHVQFQARLAEILSQYAAEREQLSFLERTA